MLVSLPIVKLVVKWSAAADIKAYAECVSRSEGRLKAGYPKQHFGTVREEFAECYIRRTGLWNPCSY